jgi:hypothetical protein
VRQQPALSLKAPTVAGQRAIGSDHAVAGHDNPNRIRSIRQPNCAYGGRPPNPLRELAIRDGGSAGNFPQLLPYYLLEWSSSCAHRQVIDDGKLSRKIISNRGGESMRIAGRLKPGGIFSIL